MVPQSTLFLHAHYCVYRCIRFLSFKVVSSSSKMVQEYKEKDTHVTSTPKIYCPIYRFPCVFDFISPIIHTITLENLL